MFVVMKSEGEYDSYSSSPVYVVREREAVETLVKALNADAADVAAEDYYRGALRLEGHIAFQKMYPPPPGVPYPAYDRSRAADKEYIKTHTKEKHAYPERVREWHDTIYTPWQEQADEFAIGFENSNFDPAKIHKSKEYDIPYYDYQEVEEVATNT